jgi:CubicO group peptidase (beta-lactamase class C family)
MTSTATAGVEGHCVERFARVHAAFACNIETGRDVGASLAVFHDGELAVDLWGGTIDDHGTPWHRDTIVNVWSTTKTVASLCALVLADEGRLDLDAPVATYWPEFGAAGKEAVLVRHVLGHSAGLPYWEAPVTVEDILDWDRACGLLAGQSPLWEPGTTAGYHAVTQGFLIGEVVRRITNVSLGSFLRDRIAGPLDADFHIGVPETADHRVAPVIPTAPVEADEGTLLAKVLTRPRVTAEDSFDVRWRRAEVPAGNGHGNARSVATIQHVLACGGALAGRALLSAETIDRVFEVQFEGEDLVLGVPLRWGIGYALGPGSRACYWGGWGGSLVFTDADARLTVAYVMNRMSGGALGDDRGPSLVAAALDAAAGH